MKGDVTVPQGETLVIDRGATIKFDGFYVLMIEGSLRVNGEPNDGIYSLPDIDAKD